MFAPVSCNRYFFKMSLFSQHNKKAGTRSVVIWGKCATIRNPYNEKFSLTKWVIWHNDDVAVSAHSRLLCTYNLPVSTYTMDRRTPCFHQIHAT